MVMVEAHHKEEPKDAKPQPLQMEHIFLPIGMWFVGILISLFCFIAEIIINRGRKSKNKTDVKNIEDIEDIKET